jgi:hypothetical protein
VKISTPTQSEGFASKKEPLLGGLVASTRMLFVALCCVVLFFVLFLKAIVGLAMVALAALHMLAQWMVGLVCSTDEMRAFFFAAAR